MEIAHIWEPLDEVGGDYLYYEQPHDNSIAFEIGDVIGHGTNAGLVMTSLHGLLHGLREAALPVDRVLKAVNDYLCRIAPHHSTDRPQSHGGRPQSFQPPADMPLLASMFVLRIDLFRRVLFYSNAGHPPPLYFAQNSDGVSILPLSSGGVILGVAPTVTYEARSVRPAPGDAVLFFTDGLTECENLNGEPFGSGDRLTQLISDLLVSDLRRASAHEAVIAVANKLADFRGAAPMKDDLAVAVIRFTEKW